MEDIGVLLILKMFNSKGKITFKEKKSNLKQSV